MIRTRGLGTSAWLAGVACALLSLAGSTTARAAQTERDASVMNTTQLVVKLTSPQTVPVSSHFEADPPTIILEFPDGVVNGSLPERSVLQQGVIEEIRTVYGSSPSSGGRWVARIAIQLRGRYAYDVHTAPGKVFIDIRHPVSVGSQAVEVGLVGGASAGGSPSIVSERFRAMQAALTQASPQPWILRASSESDSSLSVEPQGAQASSAAAASSKKPTAILTTPRLRSIGSPAGADPRSSHDRDSLRSPRAARSAISWLWLLLGVALIVGAAILLTVPTSASGVGKRFAGPWSPKAPSESSAGIRVIDQLMWKAFERQGYQLQQLLESSSPPGMLRLIAKDGLKSALLCTGDGAFFEQTTVEKFLRTLRKLQIERGVLVAPGVFTIPAQRFAKQHGISLIGRDQLTQLVSDGAITEHYTAQMQQLETQLREAKDTLAQYSQQLDVLRRQRNEASWYLGEERAKAGKQQAELDDLRQQVQQWQARSEQWQQSAETLRKQWEESEWYLGESRSAGRHIEEQLRALTESLEQQRQERQALESELASLRDRAERRRAPRVRGNIPVELFTESDKLIFSGLPTNISRTGLGFTTSEPLPKRGKPIKVRLRLAGREQPFEATGRLMWTQQSDESQPASAGCKFVELPDDGLELFQQALANPS